MTAGATIFIYMNLLYVVAMIQKNAGLVDVGWGFGFVLTALALFVSREETTTLHLLMLGFITLWGLRLTWHIGRRNIGKDEDWRYANWRKEWGKTYPWRSYLQIFMLQGLMMLLISASSIVAFSSLQDPSFYWLAAGVFLWWFGYIFEVVGDKQLESFVAKKKSNKTKKKYMTEGLWRYTRHPNYFGEVTQWWGLWLLVVSLPYGWAAVISPMTITILILFVSGVPMLEAKHMKDKTYQRYAAKTSKFIPLPPRN